MAKRMIDVSLDEFHDLTLAEKASLLMEDGREFHVLVAQQFNRSRLDEIGNLATCIRQVAKTEEGMSFLRSLLANKRAMLYFSQPSSRTFLSFTAACQILGIQTGEVRDPSVSSEFKGETREDSVRTFSSYFDLIIMRTEIGGLAERIAWTLSHSERPVPIMNAGSGKDQHPTQALLDIYTLQRSFENSGGIDGKSVMFVGDLARGRTVRSLAALLTQYKDVKLFFVAPDQLQIGEDILQMLREANVDYEVSGDFEGTMARADAIYMTRVQHEWDEQGESEKIDVSKYCFTTRHLEILKKDAVLMHPFPRKGEISPDVDHDPRAVYWRQMRNGMWARAALIASVFRCDGEIIDYFKSLPEE
jgi:aspartate carbamoyltransferase catalytic subunit